MMYSILLFLCSLLLVESALDASIDIGGAAKRKVEDSIPIVEIRGEGKPMTSAQIRHLEEMSNGGKPLDIKVEKNFVPSNCPRQAERKDFVTFHYKVFLEDGRKIHQSYGGEPVRMQLGVGMTLPGLDKGLQGVCVQEMRKIQVPHRLAQRAKSKVWKHIPTDEHWVAVSVDVQDVQPYTPELQFQFLDLNNDTKLTQDELRAWSEKMKEYGKVWRNKDIDNVMAAKYYVSYFDVNGDGSIDFEEWSTIMRRDEQEMEGKKSKEKGRKRDPGLAWILDFNNDGIVSYKESDEAADLLENQPTRLPVVRDEL